MKYLYLPLLLLFITQLSYAQDYPAFKFKTIKSQWDYFSIDTNYIKNELNFHVTKYSTVFDSQLFKFKDHIYLYQFSSSPLDYIWYNGYLLHKLDFKTGKLEWLSHRNTNNKNYELSKFSQIGFDNNHFITSDGNIGIITKVAKDTFTVNDAVSIYYFADLTECIIDNNTGKTISLIKGNNRSKTRKSINWAQNQIYIRDEHDYCQLTYNYEVENDTTIEKANFYNINEDMTLDTSAVQKIVYNTNLPSLEALYDKANYYNTQLNKDTILLINYVFYPNDLAYNPEKATLRWIDISDRDAIKEVHKLDIKPYYILPDRNYYKEQPTVQTLDNNIIVSQRIFADKSNPFKGTYWVLWLDAKGNTRSSVRKLQVGTKVYELIYPYTVRGERLYLMGEYTDGNTKGIDLVEIHAGTNEVRTTTNLINYPHLNNSRRIASDAAIWIDEEYSAFGFTMYKDTTRLTSDYFYYIGVRNQDLGIASSVHDVAQTIDCTIYPNPTVDQVTITFGSAYTGTLRLHDVHGQSVIQPITLKDTDHFDLSLSDLPSGVYYLQLDDGRGSTQVVGRPIMKM